MLGNTLICQIADQFIRNQIPHVHERFDPISQITAFSNGGSNQVSGGYSVQSKVLIQDLGLSTFPGTRRAK